MTTIAAYTDGTQVWMGSDSAVTSGQRIWYGRQKVMRFPTGGGRFALIGWAGLAAYGDRLVHNLHLDLQPFTGIKYPQPWAHAVAEELTRLAFSATPAMLEDGVMDAVILLGHEGRLWEISDNFAHPLEDYGAVGSGDAYALGALNAMTEHIGVEVGPDGPDGARVVTTAVAIASRWDPMSNGPVHLCVA